MCIHHTLPYFTCEVILDMLLFFIFDRYGKVCFGLRISYLGVIIYGLLCEE